MSNNVPTVNVKVIEVDELKDKIPSSGTRDDKELERLCVVASLTIEAMTGGRVFIQRTFTEKYTGGVNDRLGGAKRIFLNHGPIVSITSITDADGNTVSSTDYTVDAQQGILEHDGYWPRPEGRWTIVYIAGVWADTDDVDWDVKDWARIQALKIQKQRGDIFQSTTLSGRSGSRSVTRGGVGIGGPASRTDFENAMLAKYRWRWV